jgi:hypothetical protein
MDEDHDRSYTQYITAIKTLRKGLKQRGLRPAMWNDSGCRYPAAHIFVEKALAAEQKITKDVVQVLWDYRTTRPRLLGRLMDRGFTVWGAPGHTPELMAEAWKTLCRCGASGILFTHWQPCRRSRRKVMLDWIRAAGRACGGA